MLSELDLRPIKQPKSNFVLKPKSAKPVKKQCFYHNHQLKQEKPKSLRKVCNTESRDKFELKGVSNSSLSVDHATLPNVPAKKGLFGARGPNQSALSRLGGNFIAAHHD